MHKRQVGVLLGSTAAPHFSREARRRPCVRWECSAAAGMRSSCMSRLSKWQPLQVAVNTMTLLHGSACSLKLPGVLAAGTIEQSPVSQSMCIPHDVASVCEC